MNTAQDRTGSLDTAKVAVVFDGPLANLINVTLLHGSYETRRVTGEAAIRALCRDWQPDLALIDLDRHPDAIAQTGGGLMGGGTPVIAFTRKRETRIKLQAYEQGADDMVEVPFTLDEIVARPYALMRRARGMRIPLVPKVTLGGRLEVDLLEQTVKMDGSKPLDLTPIQQTLLYLLAANAGEVLTREMLLGSIWGGAFQIESNVVDRHIRELRVKLGDDWKTPRYLETIPGQGYRFSKVVAELASSGAE
ncbi:MAG TPA: response regulator transcription factor [Candidatus Limnocylindrales bacterium]|nr:response regulator transcription factor [Candidatus Limnocylindrales bacterium]